MGGDDHLAALIFAMQAGVALNFVSFNGNAEATAVLLGGHIDAFDGNMSEASAQINEVTVRALAVWSGERMPQIPDVPTGSEQGFEVISAASGGIAVPADIPEEAYQTLLAAASKVVANESFQEELGNLNMPIVPIVGDDFISYLGNSHETLKKLWETDPWLEQKWFLSELKDARAIMAHDNARQVCCINTHFAEHVGCLGFPRVQGGWLCLPCDHGSFPDNSLPIQVDIYGRKARH